MYRRKCNKNKIGSLGNPLGGTDTPDLFSMAAYGRNLVFNSQLITAPYLYKKIELRNVQDKISDNLVVNTICFTLLLLKK